MSEIKPALTAEEWAECRRIAERTWPDFDSEARHAAMVESIALDEGPLKAAAFALHGQPFGFTWEDVDLLDSWFEPPDAMGPIPAKVRNFRDRIAALLPPREP